MRVLKKRWNGMLKIASSLNVVQRNRGLGSQPACIGRKRPVIRSGLSAERIVMQLNILLDGNNIL